MLKNIKNQLILTAVIFAVILILLPVVNSCTSDYMLEVSVNPEGSGTVLAPVGVIPECENLPVFATPADGYIFDYWSGDATGTENPINITVDKDMHLIANFKIQHKLTTLAEPLQSGTVTPSEGYFDDGESVTLTAIPAEGYLFDYWNGDVSGNHNTVSINMKSSIDAVAVFKLDVVSVELLEGKAKGLLSVEAVGSGSLTEIELHLQSNIDKFLSVEIRAGTVFAFSSTDVQNMVILKTTYDLLWPNDWSLLDIDAACANMEKRLPDEEDSLSTICMTPNKDLLLLLNLPEFNDESFNIKQFAVWTITDNPARDDYVGISRFLSSSNYPDDDDFDRIKTLFQNAGINTDKYQSLR